MKINADPFLNRLAINEMMNPKDIDPYRILENLSDYIGLIEMQEQFSLFCAAAMAEKFTWKEDNPGRLFQFSELLEQLLEACYLIHARSKRKKEIDSSLQIITDFFADISLPEWKLTLHDWTIAALSNHSVVESVKPSTILPFVQNIEKLIDTALGKISFRKKDG